jgi:hypothetical protein
VSIAGLDLPLQAVGVGGREGGANILKPNTVFEQRRWIEFSSHCGKRAAADRNLSDPFDPGQLLCQHCRCGIVKIALPQCIGDQR